MSKNDKLVSLCPKLFQEVAAALSLNPTRKYLLIVLPRRIVEKLWWLEVSRYAENPIQDFRLVDNDIVSRFAAAANAKHELQKYWKREDYLKLKNIAYARVKSYAPEQKVAET